jgi:hypothetical protein
MLELLAVLVVLCAFAFSLSVLENFFPSFFRQHSDSSDLPTLNGQSNVSSSSLQPQLSQPSNISDTDRDPRSEATRRYVWRLTVIKETRPNGDSLDATGWHSHAWKERESNEFDALTGELKISDYFAV